MKQCKCQATLPENYEDLLFLTSEQVKKVGENIITLFSLVKCPDNCKDLEMVLALIEKEISRTQKLLDVVIEGFDPECFICSPYRIFSQLLEIQSLLKGITGLLCFLPEVQADCKEGLCSEINVLHIAHALADVARRLTQNINREYICDPAWQ